MIITYLIAELKRITLVYYNNNFINSLSRKIKKKEKIIKYISEDICQFLKIY